MAQQERGFWCCSDHGCFFPPGTLLPYIQKVAVSLTQEEIAPYLPFFSLQPEIRRSAIARAEEHTESSRNLPCPKCALPMRTFRYQGTTDLFVDRCPICGGVFLDPGEERTMAAIFRAYESVREETLAFARGVDPGDVEAVALWAPVQQSLEALASLLMWINPGIALTRTLMGMVEDLLNAGIFAQIRSYLKKQHRNHKTS